jgi:hypothetical protein
VSGGGSRRSKPKTVRKDRCGPSGKLRYRTRNAALLALAATIAARLLPHGTRRRERRVYHCILCNGWHLTSKKRVRAAIDGVMHSAFTPAS